MNEVTQEMLGEGIYFAILGTSEHELNLLCLELAGALIKGNETMLISRFLNTDTDNQPSLFDEGERK